MVHPRWWGEPLAAATLPLADRRTHVTLLDRDIPLQYLHPRVLPATEWAKCCVMARFGAAVVWCIPLCTQKRDAFATPVPTCAYHGHPAARLAYEGRY